IAVIHDANHRVFWLVHNWRAELGGCEKPEDRNPKEGILSIGIFITNYGAIETSCNSTWFQPNLPIASVSAKEAQTNSPIPCTFHIRTHVPRPILVVTDRQKSPMVEQEITPAVGIHVGGIRNVIPLPLQKPKHVVFPRHK